MYHLTLRVAPNQEVDLRIPNQDLARTVMLLERLRVVNPAIQVSYSREPSAIETEHAA